MTTQLAGETVVIGEGRDEVCLVDAIARQLGVAGLQVLSFEGVGNLRGFLRALPAVAGFTEVRSLGILCDAEDDAAARLRSVQDGLAAAGLPVPVAPLSRTPGRPAIIVLINPHGSSTGSLDDVCAESVRTDPAMACVGEYLDCLRRAGIPTPRPGKTLVHAFIASRDRPEVSLGVALQRGYFPLEDRAFDPVRRFLTLVSQ